MADTAFAVGAGHVNAGKTAVGMSGPGIQLQDIIQPRLIGLFPLGLKQGQLMQEVIQCLGVVHKGKIENFAKVLLFGRISF
jgi:hypothetical protein